MMDPASLDYVFKPSSVAIVGASRNPGKIGHVILRNILESGYRGRVYPININGGEILGLKAYTSIDNVNEDIDLIVVAVPAKYVNQVVKEAGEKGVKAAVIITAGFKEVGGEGVERERELARIVDRYGIRMIGPNCLGVIDTYTPINTTFAQVMPKRGNIAFISQSGAMCTATLDWAVESYIGFSKVVSIGNKTSTDELDLIQYLADDDETKAILLYVESIDNGQDFIELAREVTRRKPILVLKGGITEAGAKAAISHTGALAGRFEAYQAAFKKAGIILATDVSQLFDYAVALSTQPVTKGAVAVISNAGGLCILTADQLVRRGIRLATFSDDTIERLRARLPPTAAIYNPVDIVGDGDKERYLDTLDIILSDDNVSTVICLLAPTALIDPYELAVGISEAKERYPEKAIITAFVGGPLFREAKRYLMEVGIPYMDMTVRAVDAAYALYKYREIRDRKPCRYVTIHDVDHEYAASIIQRVRMDGRNVLMEHEAKELLKAYGISVPKSYLAKSPIDAVSAAEYIGYPVVMKVASPDILHKTDIGGVRLNLEGPDEVEDAYEDIIANASRLAPKARLYGVLVEEMVDVGVEAIVGVTMDLQFGHLMMFGMGGVYTELFRDVSFSVLPICREDAVEMIKETKLYHILRGYRGLEPMDMERTVDTLLRINQLIRDFPEIVELDVNPLSIYQVGKGVKALDVKIVLAREVK